MIELRQLKYFVAVAELRHFGRAAEQLRIAQPTLSQQIRALEQLLDVRLFDRSKRSISVTAAGVLLLEEAKATLRHAALAREVAERASRAEAGRIAIGCSSSSPFTEALPAILRAFTATHPGVELMLDELTAPQQMEALENGSLDFGLFLSGYATQRPAIRASPLLRERYGVVMSSTHRLAAHDRIELAELADESLIAYGTADSVGRLSPGIDICRRAGFAPRVVHWVAQIPTVVSLAAGGLGIAIVPDSLSQMTLRGACFRPLAVEDVSMLVFACRRNERAPATLALIEAARRYAAATAARAQ